MQVLSINQVTPLPYVGSFWLTFWQRIDWQQILMGIGGRVGEILLFSFLFWIIDRLGKQLIKRLFARHDPVTAATTASNRVRTIYTLSQNIFHYIVLFFYLYALLSVLGVPVGTLIAGAGIFSLALGLGAQGFVNDLVTGFFILLEHQLDVGDNVKIGNIEGIVSAIGLRTTQITSADGTLNFVPNRNITIISNRSRNNMRVQVDLQITPATPLDLLRKVIEQTTEQLLPQEDLLGDPDIQGATTDDLGNLVFRVQFLTKNGAQAPLQRAFLNAYLAAVTAAGIKLAAAPTNLKTPTSAAAPTSAASVKVKLPSSSDSQAN